MRRLALVVLALAAAPAAHAESVVYSGDRLTGIDFPVGPVGYGGIQHLGDGTRNEAWIFNVDAQINSTFNRHQERVPHSFFAVRAQRAGRDPVVRALQTVAEGPFAPVDALTFRGEYPLAEYRFADDDLPVDVVEHINSPMVPGDLAASSYPTAIYEFVLRNPSDEPVNVSLLATQQNAVGFDAQVTPFGEIDGRTHPGYGANVNRIRRDGRGTHLDMTGCTAGAPVPLAARCNGSMALSLLGAGATGTAAWDTEPSLLADFAGDGALRGPVSAKGKLPAHETVDGALATTTRLAPGAQVRVRVLLSWYIPQSNVREFGGEGVEYTTRFSNAQDVDRTVTTRLASLQRGTRAFHAALYDSNLPHYVLDRLSSQLATLATPVVFRAQNGFFGGYEGFGCCTAMPTHVWQYTQAPQRLWPQIDRRWTTQWLRNVLPGGLIPYRYIAPQFSMDGQTGVILMAYRHFLNTGDRAWLDRYWLNVRQAMDFVILKHDPDHDGMLSGEQQTTLDSTQSGTGSWLGTMYLAAVRAAERMAALEGDALWAKRYGKLFDTGRANQERALWNGAWYIEKPEARVTRTPDQPLLSSATDSYGNGVIADMLLGQWWATQLGLGDIYDSGHMTRAAQTLFASNFREDFAQYDTHGGRHFVEPADKGLVMMTWPRGDRPADSSKYADEVWSGQEYGTAALLIQRGHVDEGLRMIKAIFDRYDGRLRTKMALQNCGALDGGGNPFGDDECGKWYVRAWSNWSVLLALQGFSYDASRREIGFAPRWQPADHRSFFSAGDAWGTFAQRRDGGRQTDTITVRHGRLRLDRVALEGPDGKRVVVRRPVTLEAGESLTIEL